MKKIIKGKRYNTETATEIGHYSYGSYDNFNHIEETLYRTPKGNWFLVGGGGPKSKYAKPVSTGGLTGDSNVFTVLSESEAYDWMERHTDAETIEEYFQDDIEDA